MARLDLSHGDVVMMATDRICVSSDPRMFRCDASDAVNPWRVHSIQVQVRRIIFHVQRPGSLQLGGQIVEAAFPLMPGR
jgi:hypothetical protein